MPRPWPVLALAAIVAAAIAGERRHASPSHPPIESNAETISRTELEPVLDLDHPSGPAVQLRAEREMIVLSGIVIDESDGSPVAGAEVVIRGAAGESTTTSEATGEYAIAVAPGVYRAFVRDDEVMSVGESEGSGVEIAGLPDDSLMPVIVAITDTHGIELGVVRGGAIHGRITNDDGDPVAGALVHAVMSGELAPRRPILGTDVAESDSDGAFELRVPEGRYTLRVSHPQYATLDDRALSVAAGQHASTSFELSRGCAISGHVVRDDGSAVTDGAIERATGDPERFEAAAQIDSDGTFRFTTTDEDSITIRAWPSRSAPSPTNTFVCHEGARFHNIVFKIPSRTPDVAGIVVDANGAPVPLAVVDLVPLDDLGTGSQVRTDLAGTWQIYDSPPGHYVIRATAPGHGIVAEQIATPKRELELRLGGTGSIAGTTTTLANGSFELRLESCSDGFDHEITLAHETRIVSVANGRFAVDDVPACVVGFTARWHGKTSRGAVEVAVNESADLELDIGPPRAKLISGVVRDIDDLPLADITIRATLDGIESESVTSDGSGRYRIHAFSGSRLMADYSGSRRVSHDNVDQEEIDIYVWNPQ